MKDWIRLAETAVRKSHQKHGDIELPSTLKALSEELTSCCVQICRVDRPGNGVPLNFFVKSVRQMRKKKDQWEEEAKDHFIADLKAQGAEIVDPFVIPEYDKLTEKIGCGDFQKDLNAYLALHAPNAYYKSLSEIVDSGLYLPYIEARLKANVAPKTEAQLARGPCVDTYHDPKKIAFRDAVLAEMEKQHVDALIYPTWSNPPRKVGDMKSPAGDNSQVLSPQTGFPAITVPMGFTYDSLPAGMTILGRSFSEGLLIKYAYAYEQATKHRRPPAGFGPVE